MNQSASFDLREPDKSRSAVTSIMSLIAMKRPSSIESCISFISMIHTHLISMG